MNIYGEMPDERLDSVVSFDPPTARDNYLFVVHPNDTDDWIEQELKEKLKDNYCRGILLVKGVPRAGLTNEEFTKLKKQYGDRFHVSACSVGGLEENTKLSGDIENRFKNFFNHVRSSDNKIDWSILDPQWPDKLFSAYLLAKVMSSDTSGADVLESQAAEWQLIWEGAQKEHKLLTDVSLTHSQLNKGTAKDIAEQIKQYLQKVALRVS